jgi:hypothetical protein
MGYRTILGLDLGKFKSVCCAMDAATGRGRKRGLTLGEDPPFGMSQPASFAKLNGAGRSALTTASTTSNSGLTLTRARRRAAAFENFA